MVENWIESVFLKRAVLALAGGAAAHLTALLAAPVALHVLAYLQSIGLTVTIIVDQAKFSQFLTVALFAAEQGAHEWVAAKWPELGKYL